MANYKKQRYVCVVEADEEGKLAFVLEDGKRFKSPSSAASAVMGGSAANGWRFWALESEQTAAAPDAAQGAPDGPKAPRTRTRSKEAASEATGANEGDYLIDSDGRPINQDGTPAVGEGEDQADADRA